MEPEKGVLDEFEKDFKVEKHEVDPLEIPAKEEVVAPKKEEVEEETEPRKNRRERRLEAKLQSERETSIELAARLKALSETDRFKKEVAPDADLHAILFGDAAETPETRATASRLAKVLESHTVRARDEALKAFKEDQEKAIKAEKDAEKLLDSELEALEDEYDVDLTSDSPAARKERREFLEVVQKLSPKDSEGNIKDYADFKEAFEIFQSRKERPDTTRQKGLASRSMTRSSSSASSTGKSLEEQNTEKYLIEHGFI